MLSLNLYVKVLHSDVKPSGLMTARKPFEKTISLLANSNVLVYYNPNLPITLAGNESTYDIGVITSHIKPDELENPIDFDTLSPSECNCS